MVCKLCLSKIAQIAELGKEKRSQWNFINDLFYNETARDYKKKSVVMLLQYAAQSSIWTLLPGFSSCNFGDSLYILNGSSVSLAKLNFREAQIRLDFRKQLVYSTTPHQV